MLSYEQLKPALYVWARYWRKKFRKRFELDELVNAVWVRNKVQFLPNVRIANKKIRWEMLSYIESELGLRKKNRPLFITNLDSYYDDPEHHNDDTMASLAIDESDYIQQLEAKDLKDVVWPYLNNRYKQVLRLRYFDDTVLPEGKRHNNYSVPIGRILGLGESGVSTLLMRAIDECRCVLGV